MYSFPSPEIGEALAGRRVLTVTKDQGFQRVLFFSSRYSNVAAHVFARSSLYSVCNICFVVLKSIQEELCNDVV
jgi:hypothetical protein